MNHVPGPQTCPTCGKATPSGTTCAHCDSSKAKQPSRVGAQPSVSPAPLATHLPQIAIVGTEGSGKTVLITALAKRFSQVSADGTFLNPLNNKTLKYVESTWQTLSAGEWPPSTPAGQLIDLQWRLQADGFECDVRLVDPPGQDLRRLFSEDEPATIDRLPSHLQNLAKYYQEADIVICLVNLRDFQGESDPLRRIDNEIVIKSALQRLSAGNGRERRLFLLFTQIDLYRQIRRQYGTWAHVAKQFLPYVYGAHLAPGQVKVGAVAAVHDTVVTVDADGKPRRIPAAGFESRGLDTLMDDVIKEAKAIVAADVLAQQHRAELEGQQAERESEENRRMRFRRTIISGISLALMVGLFLVWNALSPPPPLAFQLPKPSNPQVAFDIVYGRFMDDIRAQNKSTFGLHNLKFEVEATSGPSIRVHRHLECPSLVAGEVHVWPNEISVKKDSGTVECRFMDFDPFPGTWGINFGRFSDEVWIRNEGTLSAKNVSMAVQVRQRGAMQKTIRLEIPLLLPKQTFSQPASVPNDAQVTATLDGWQD